MLTELVAIHESWLPRRRTLYNAARTAAGNAGNAGSGSDTRGIANRESSKRATTPARRQVKGSNCAWVSGNFNLPLAARASLGHIRRTGDVAEWLKAAVC